MSVSSCCVPGRRVATSGSTGSDSPDSPLGTRRVQTTVRAELTSHQYKVWLPLVECSSSQTTLTLSLSFCPCFCHCTSVSVPLSLCPHLYPCPYLCTCSFVPLSVPLSLCPHLYTCSFVPLSVPVPGPGPGPLSLLLSLSLSTLLCSHDLCYCFFLTSRVHLVCESTFSFFSLHIVCTNYHHFVLLSFTVLSRCYDPQGAIKY